MERNYQKEYRDNYYNFMAVYLSGLQEAYPDIDIKSEYIEVANLFDKPFTSQGTGPIVSTRNDQSSGQIMQPKESQTQGPGPAIPVEDNQSSGQIMPPEESQTQGPGPAIPVEDDQSSSQFMPLQGVQSQNPEPAVSIGGGQSSEQFISPGGGQFTINNCRRMAIVRIVMRRGFNPSEFFMIVDRADARSIRGFRIACEGGRIRFVPMAVEYRNINLMECAL